MTEPQIMPADKAIPGRPYKRRARNILIHKPMQREFTYVIIGLLMLSTLAVGLVIHHTIHSAVFGSGAFRFGRISPYEVLSDIRYQLIIRVSCVLFLTLVVLGMFGLLFLHRVAGPVYRFRQVFIRINRGEIPGQIKLREGDFFEETAQEINRLLKRLEFEKDKSEKIKGRIDQLLSAQLPESAWKSAEEIKALVQNQYPEPKPQ
ncbi:MAG: hypothetical protein PHN49_08500 [Candidatus Omnitrophica bacterium]|nr:hypothetical protein [Candidatus Omnitrophota bacterium]MDD5671664.1 hypothetical protein [Candidatus Omnitrophota bacterium]